MKLENRNSGEMKRVYELDVYKLAEALSDMVWHDFDKAIVIKRFTTEFHGETLNFIFYVCEIFVQIRSKNRKVKFPISIFSVP